MSTLRRHPAVVLLVLALLALAGGARAEGPTPVRAGTALRCAADEAQASAAIDRIRRSQDERFGLPRDEPSEPRPAVRAARVDELLRLLLATAKRWPGLTTPVEEVVLSWNFCDVHYANRAWDLVWDGERVARSPAAPSRQWTGFGRWGFLPEDPPDRYVPDLLARSPLGLEQREWFVAALVYKRCFPHPATGRTLYDDEPPPADGSIAPPASDEPEEACPAPVSAVSSPAPARAAKTAAPALTAKAPARSSSSARAASPMPGSAAMDGRPVAIVATPSASTAGAPTHPTQPSPDKLGFAGSFYYEQRLTGAASMGSRLSFSPWSSLFARVGVTRRLGLAKDGTGYSWGIGYDDWHPGTFSAQINDWGPRLFTERPTIDTAALDIGYKLELPAKLAQHLASGVTLNIPFNDSPGVGWSWTLKPIGDLFVSAGARYSPFVQDHFTWSYGFGLSNWRPFTVSLTYANWGPNEPFALNFLKNGAVAASISWAR